MPLPVTHQFLGLFRTRNALIALVLAMVFGTVGFTLIEGWPLSDSLYVTVQTLTTGGYGGLPPHTAAGRAFAAIVMLMGVGGVALAASTIVQSVVQSELVSALGQRSQSKKMSKLDDHYIICGSGRVGSHPIRELQATQKAFIVIENDPQSAAELTQRDITAMGAEETREES